MQASKFVKKLVFVICCFPKLAVRVKYIFIWEAHLSSLQNAQICVPSIIIRCLTYFYISQKQYNYTDIIAIIVRKSSTRHYIKIRENSGNYIRDTHYSILKRGKMGLNLTFKIKMYFVIPSNLWICEVKKIAYMK